MENDIFEVKTPSVSKRVMLEIIPTENGDLLSMSSLWKKQVVPANALEKKLRLTFLLSNVISDIVTISKQIDSSSIVEVDYIKGVFKQEIGITIRSSYFTITMEKKFAQGTNTGDIMQDVVAVDIKSMYREYSEMLEKT
jgi:hypothetical protein